MGKEKEGSLRSSSFPHLPNFWHVHGYQLLTFTFGPCPKLCQPLRKDNSLGFNAIGRLSVTKNQRHGFMEGRDPGSKVTKLQDYVEGTVSVNLGITVKYFALYSFKFQLFLLMYF